MGSESGNNNMLSNMPKLMVSDIQITRVSLTRYNKVDVALINALSLKLTECNVDLYNENLICKFEYHNFLDLSKAPSQEWLAFEVGDDRFWVSISMLPDFLFIDNENLRSLVNSKSNTIKVLAYEILLGPLLQVLEDLTGLHITIKKIIKELPRMNVPGLLLLSLSNHEGDRLESQLLFGEAISSQVFSLVQRLTDKVTDNINDLSVIARLEFGSTDLSLNDIQTLEKGDVIFVDHLLSTNLSIFRAIIDPNLIVVVRIEDSNFMVEEVITDNNSEHMDSGLDNPDNVSSNNDISENAQSDLINKLQVNITFELGSISVALDELRQLQTGSIIPLNRPLGKAVNIYNNGRLLGIGELVDIENKLGVRIVGLSGS